MPLFPGPWITPEHTCADVSAFAGGDFISSTSVNADSFSGVYSGAPPSYDSDRQAAANNEQGGFYAPSWPGRVFGAGASFDSTRWIYYEALTRNFVTTSAFNAAALADVPFPSNAIGIEHESPDAVIDEITYTLHLTSITGDATDQPFQVGSGALDVFGSSADLAAAASGKTSVPATTSPGVIQTWTPAVADVDQGHDTVQGEGYGLIISVASAWRADPVPDLHGSIDSLFTVEIVMCGTPTRYRYTYEGVTPLRQRQTSTGIHTAGTPLRQRQHHFGLRQRQTGI